MTKPPSPRTILNDLRVPVCSFDEDGRFLYRNPVHVEVWGESENGLFSLLPGEIRESFRAHLSELGPEKDRGTFRTRVDGQTIEWTISLRLTETGNPVYHKIGHDVTKWTEKETVHQRLWDLVGDLAGKVALAQEEERRRIALDLHDRIIQNLAYTSMELGRLSEEKEGLRDELRDLGRLLAETADEVRAIILELSPPSLYELGFEAAARDWAERFAQRTGIRCEFSREGVLSRLSERQKVTLFQVLRELLTNVEKHAGATKVEVRLEGGDEEVVLTVADDGRGFHPETVGLEAASQEGAGFGLFGLRERFRRLGGRFEIESTPDGGTTARCSLPVGGLD